MSREHWDNVYATRTEAQVSWTEEEPLMSLALIHEFFSSGRVIDIGGGTSALAGRLREEGYEVTVLDISQTALARSQEKLGPRKDSVRWIAADVTTVNEVGTFDVW